MIANKKVSIFYVLKILIEYTDENHFLTYQDIINKIKKETGQEYERKSIANCVQLLKELDFDINSGPGNRGVALFSRLLDVNQIKFIADALFSSKSITGKDAIEIVNALNGTLSKYNRKDYSYIQKSSDINRTSNKEIFYNIDVISECIAKKKRVSFQYLTYDSDGKLTPKMDGYRFYASPYYLINNFGRYYMVSNYRAKYGALQIYRVDYMANVLVADAEGYVSMASFPELRNFDISEYLNEHIYLFNSDVIEAKVYIDDTNAIKDLYDWFGNKIHIYKEPNGKLYTTIKCAEDALYYWLLQYGDSFTLASPQSLINRLQDHYKKQVLKY